jgi:putative membrane-bound dehydrogenase-like protein
MSMPRIHSLRQDTLACIVFCTMLVSITVARAESPRIKVLFLGDNGHHKPADRAAQLIPVMAKRGIDVTYTEKLTGLEPANLRQYQCLLVYANHTKISAEQERALVEYVESGHGLVPLHCASACFGNSPKYIALVGGRFKRHATGVFTAQVIKPEHPTMQGFERFEAWDETYEHDQLSDDREVLMVRADGEKEEPWTWVRKQGKGRVFYTASGHDARCWTTPGFRELVERGIRWSIGGDPTIVATSRGTERDFDLPKMTSPAKDAKPFEYAEAKIAFYPPGGERKGDGNWNKMQLPLSPQESMKHFSVPEGFAVELFASEPQIGKPICMNWDERGRLWICETVDYPNELQPPGEGRDRIKICEDTDSDGKADKFTVFADKLSIPTSLTFSRGGVVVQQAPQTLFLQDTDDDDKADVRKVLFEGWSTRDTHAGPSNLQYGLDNWIWGMVGYSGFDGEVGGERLSFRQGFYRFRPDGSKLEFIRSTNNNTWGIGFSEEGLVFGSTANHNPSVYMPIANRYYEMVRGWSASQLGTIADTHLFHAMSDKVRQVDHHGGYTAAAGHALYTARAYPKQYWNQTAFVTEPTGHLVGTFVLRPEGSDFKSINPCNLLASDDEWSAPIMAEVGPDSQVWIIDWYNYIVQHNPTPVGFKTGKGGAYETELRDKQHGRIYRIVYRNSPKYTPIDLRKASPLELVTTLKHSNMFWRKHAQRLLVERGKPDVVSALVEVAKYTTIDELGLKPGVIHALWTMHGLGALDGKIPAARTSTAAYFALGHTSPGARRNAVAVLPRTAEAMNALAARSVLTDQDPQVRLAALLALAEMPMQPEVGKALVEMLARPENYNDHWIPDAVTCAAAAHDLHFLKALAAGEQHPAPPARVVSVVATVAEHYARGKPVESVGELLTSLPPANPAMIEAVVSGMARGWPKDTPARLDPVAEKALGQLLARVSAGNKGQLINLATRLGSPGLQKHAAEISSFLLTVAADEKAPEAKRIDAARQLVEFRIDDPKTIESLLELITPRASSELAVGLIDALRTSDSPELGPALVERYGSLTPAARAAASRLLLTRAEWTQALLNGIEQRKVQLADLTLDQKQSLTAHPDKKLATRAKDLLARGGVLPNADRQKVLEQLLPLTKQTGDVALGKAVFLKQCAKCHTHGGEGNKVGPDLTGMAVHPKAELLTHLIDPSRSVEGNYRAYTVVTDDGKILTGLLASESKTAIELFDAEGKRQAVLRENIEQLVASPKSIMPEGFEKQVQPEEIVNLLEFLTAKGKYFPLPLNKAATVVSTKGMFHAGDNGPDRLIFDDWSPKTAFGVPFQLIDPRGTSIPNAILLYGPNGTLPPSMPRSVSLPCNSKAKAVHLLSGVSGWGYPIGKKGALVMTVRLHFDDGQAEDHPLRNGEHFADYIRRVDVPGSQFAFPLRGQQIRYLAVQPNRDAVIREIELLKGDDDSAPIVMAITTETR